MQDVPKLGKVLHATAASVSDSEVHLSNGASVPFDYLVLASGSTWTDPVCSGTEATLTDRRLAQQACSTLLMMTSNPLTYLGNVAPPKEADSSLCIHNYLQP